MVSESFNIADRLSRSAQHWPYEQAIVFPEGRDRLNRVSYTHLTFQQLNDEVESLAAGLQQRGAEPGKRLVLMVKLGIEFIALTFAIFRTGATVVLIDPGMGRKRIFDCLDEIDPHGFVALPIVHLIRKLRIGKFPQAKLNVSAGGKVNWGGVSYLQLLKEGQGKFRPVKTTAQDQAAIIFTSGSTGPPKGVVYEHGMFNAQVNLLQEQYGILPGERDLPGFPLFALFNLAMGVTTVIPDMDPTKPAQVDPLKILEGLQNQAITQAYGSPALWNRVGKYCVEQKVTFPLIKRVLSAGAPVPVHVLEKMQQVCVEPESEIHTPYGATEALPVCTIGSQEVLQETSRLTAIGKGTCVGRPFPQVDVEIIEPQTGPIAEKKQSRVLPVGEIGEIIVRSPSVTREYYQKPEATSAAKIPDGETFWHRMGDMGYFDEQGRVWFCGRKAHIVQTSNETMYPVCCEAIFNEHAKLYRSALVGVGTRGDQKPVLVAEPYPDDYPKTAQESNNFRQQLFALGEKNSLTKSIQTILFHPSLPVDKRHNVKIHREELAIWASEKLKRASSEGQR